MILVLSVVFFHCECTSKGEIKYNNKSYKIMKYLFFNQPTRSDEENMFGRKNENSVEHDSQYKEKKVKRYRSAFTTGQITYLEKQFKKCPYIGNTSRKEVAHLLNISERAIKIWFQNRRMKEKKEAVNVEYVDRQNNVINNLEITNNSLNNVHSSQSPNDRQNSLQPVISQNIDNINFTYSTHDMEENTSKPMRFETLKQGTVEYYPYKTRNTEKAKIETLFSGEKASLSKYDINTEYNNINFIKYLEKNNNEGATVKGDKLTPKIRSKTNKRSTQSASTHGHQELPEDLSGSSNTIVAQNRAGNVNLTSTYIPFCNSQNYFTPCVSAGNIIWKPVNVMPFIAANNLTVPVPENQPNSIYQSNVRDSKCNCNCHLKSSLNYDQRMKKCQPQYVIAIPYNNNCNQ